MTFDFFNTSDLAFGAKLTAAFKSLNNIKDEARDNVQDILNNLDIFKEYLNRNYQVPAPIRPTSACRTDEIFNLFKGSCFIKEMKYSKDTDKVTFGFVLYDIYSNRITIANGESNLSNGYVFARKSISNKNMERELRITDKKEKEDNGEILLFEYTVDKEALGEKGRVLIKDWGDILLIRAYDFSQYTKMSMMQLSDGSPYTAKSNECIMITLRQHFGTGGANVKLNGTTIYKLAHGVSSYVQDHVILYLRKGDKVEFEATAYAYLFRIKYE